MYSLLQSIEASNVKKAADILANPDLNPCAFLVRNSKGYSALDLAILKGKTFLPIVHKITTHTQFTDAYWLITNKSGHTAYHTAARYGKLQALDILFRNDKEKKAAFQKDVHQYKPWHHAAIQGHIDCVTYLFEQFYSSIPTICSLEKLIHFSASGHCHDFSMLLETDGNALLADMQLEQIRWNPLHWAMAGRTENHRLIIDAIMDTQILTEDDASLKQDKDGDTPAHIAAFTNNVSNMKRLLDHPNCPNAIWSATNIRGLNILHQAVCKDNLGMVDFLLQHPKCPENYLNSKTTRGETATMLAKKFGLDLMQVILWDPEPIDDECDNTLTAQWLLLDETAKPTKRKHPETCMRIVEPVKSSDLQKQNVLTPTNRETNTDAAPNKLQRYLPTEKLTDLLLFSSNSY